MSCPVAKILPSTPGAGCAADAVCTSVTVVTPVSAGPRLWCGRLVRSLAPGPSPDPFPDGPMGITTGTRSRHPPRGPPGRATMPGVTAVRTSVLPPYAAQLRVYEPLAAYPEPERARWQAYAAEHGPDAAGPDEPVAAAALAEQRRALAALAGRTPGALPRP